MTADLLFLKKTSFELTISLIQVFNNDKRCFCNKKVNKVDYRRRISTNRKKIFRMYLDGNTMGGIARKLTEEGIETPKLYAENRGNRGVSLS